MEPDTKARMVPMRASRHYSSKKRDAVFEALASTKAHPTAEMLFRTLEKDHPGISLSTVYRCLNEFCEDGSAVVVGTVDGSERYDACTVPHPHRVCSRCRSVTDLPVTDALERAVGAVTDELEALTGCELSSWSLTFTGMCPACAAEEHNITSTEVC